MLIVIFLHCSLDVEQGEFSDSEIIVLLGENGTGKTTYIRMMAGKLEPDSGTGNLSFHCNRYPHMFPKSVQLDFHP